MLDDRLDDCLEDLFDGRLELLACDERLLLGPLVRGFAVEPVARDREPLAGRRKKSLLPALLALLRWTAGRRVMPEGVPVVAAPRLDPVSWEGLGTREGERLTVPAVPVGL